MILYDIKRSYIYHTLQLLKPFGIAGFTASPLSEKFPYSRLLWEFPFRGSTANPTIAQSRIYLPDIIVELFGTLFLFLKKNGFETTLLISLTLYLTNSMPALIDQGEAFFNRKNITSIIL